MRVLDEKVREVRVQVELTGRELQLIHRALENVETHDVDVRTDEGTLASEFFDVLDEHGLDVLNVK